MIVLIINEHYKAKLRPKSTLNKKRYQSIPFNGLRSINDRNSQRRTPQPFHH